jgi:hypothetical protein
MAPTRNFAPCPHEVDQELVLEIEEADMKQIDDLVLEDLQGQNTCIL